MALHTAEQRGSSALAFAGACLLGVAGVLTGCNLQGTPPAPPQTAPHLQTGRGFFFNQDGGGATLAYGKANSDDLDLMLQCDRGSREIQVIDAAHTLAPAKGAVTLTLASGQTSSDLKAELAADETGQTLASSHASSDLPAFTAFRKTGQISVKLRGHVYALAATPAELIGVAKFFAVCEKK